MAQFSHSKLSSFEQCKYKYKLKYIDKIKPPVEKSIESHLGSATHDALEWLYNEKLKKNLPTLDQVLEKFIETWNKDFTNDILIVKEQFTAKDYFNKGIKFILDYYTKHAPFDEGTLENEKRIWVELEKDYPHKIIGFIDRLSFNKETGEYEIHDYKTANSLPPKSKFEEDRQLALYSIGIKQLVGNHHNVALIWHYLNHDMQITSRRTNEQLEQLKKDIINLISKIESNTEWETSTSILCNWCEYKPWCKQFGNSIPSELKKPKQETLF